MSLPDLVGVPKADVSVVAGRSSRHKRILVAGVDAAAAVDALRNSGGVLSSRAHEPGEEVIEEDDPKAGVRRARKEGDRPQGDGEEEAGRAPGCAHEDDR
jgi:hypothetical protein